MRDASRLEGRGSEEYSSTMPSWFETPAAQAPHHEGFLFTAAMDCFVTAFLAMTIIEKTSPVFQTAGRQADNDLALSDHRQQQHWQCHKQRRSSQRAPRNLLERQHIING